MAMTSWQVEVLVPLVHNEARLFFLSWIEHNSMLDPKILNHISFERNLCPIFPFKDDSFRGFSKGESVYLILLVVVLSHDNFPLEILVFI